MPIVNFRAEPELIAAADAGVRVLRDGGDTRSRSDHLRDCLRELARHAEDVDGDRDADGDGEEVAP